jgi:pyroglutamyl-peptidase
MALTILLTGFGPFPGAPFNPTGPLIRRLARVRRPAFAEVRLVTHVFPTSYRAVDRELPELLSRLKPDAVLMFGLAARTPHIRVESRARNALSSLTCDAEGQLSFGTSIVAGGPAALAFPPFTKKLVLAARAARVPARLSRDAGNYLCNYLCWRAIEAAAKPCGPQVVAFIHIPNVGRRALPRRAQRRCPLQMEELVRGGTAMLLTVIATARVRRHMKER